MDNEAELIFLDILRQEPGNIDASWGAAEVMRRRYQLGRSREILQDILDKNPFYNKAKISLAYILSKDGDAGKALKMIRSVIDSSAKNITDASDLAMAYMLLGSINAERSAKGGLFGKVNYGLKIRANFERANALAPDLPEVHLGLGTFYLRAPKLFGGNIAKAVRELKTAVEIAPGFATPYARLAEAYIKSGDEEKYKEYLQKALALDPENEVALDLIKETDEQ
ncbi:MAG: TRAP transporter TatT component family protein [Candidatus Omnitrophica bacterium]|nr:TRAP transporter TatT component family protein [Candidatus Omnitrophota bacterium]